MMPCYNCKNKDEIPGSAHIKCRLAINEKLGIGSKMISGIPLTLDEQKSISWGKEHGWFAFPVEFDPVWGPDRCMQFAELK